jgi:prevent-host-death family protein
MQSIGVRELRQDASRWLARVRAGESFVITDRGTPIAELGPLRDQDGYNALLAAGRLVPGSGRPIDTILDELNEAVAIDGEASLSTLLAEQRADER